MTPVRRQSSTKTGILKNGFLASDGVGEFLACDGIIFQSVIKPDPKAV